MFVIPPPHIAQLWLGAKVAFCTEALSSNVMEPELGRAKSPRRVGRDYISKLSVEILPTLREIPCRSVEGRVAEGWDGGAGRGIWENRHCFGVCGN